MGDVEEEQPESALRKMKENAWQEKKERKYMSMASLPSVLFQYFSRELKGCKYFLDLRVRKR